MKIILKILTLALVIFLPNITTSAYSIEKIKIGLLAPITGENSNLGKSILKAARMAINKINDPIFEIVPKDTGSNPEQTLISTNELRAEGIKIVIGPIFQKNLQYLGSFNEMTFISFTNKNYKNPRNVLSAGINAESQINTIKKFLIQKKLKKTLVLIPENDFKNEVDFAIERSNFDYKKKFYYNTSPIKINEQIQKFTNYNQRKKNLEDEIKRIENSNIENKEKKIEELKKKDTLGTIGFDSVVICDFEEGLRSVATSLLYSDVSSKEVAFISLNQWFNSQLVKEKTIHPLYFPSINDVEFELFQNNFNKHFDEIPSHLSLMSYDLIGLVYYLVVQNNLSIDKKIFQKKNKFKGTVGIFEINKNKITHILNFYETNEHGFKKIF